MLIYGTLGGGVEPEVGGGVSSPPSYPPLSGSYPQAMWPFRKSSDKYVKRAEFEELIDEVRSLQMRLRKLRARHLAEDNVRENEEARSLDEEARRVLAEAESTAQGTIADRATLNRMMFQRRRH